MPAVSDLSPLAFEVLKYLCNVNASGYVTLDKDTLGISSQEDFLNALQELQVNGLILLSRDPGYVVHTSPEDIATEAMTHSENADNTEPISAKLLNEDGETCKALDYYLEAGRE